ncbi:hypothetical protein BDN71DRAFT_1510606 [Pleurotus eryngii]|uniref:Uncharacterized protein n=1 Tax=Pleurotus eryngii TaxID=5323 RepID=A0A9P5ZQ61_PLEER|nr:hypothetical protein BDN71DRAFT_1510606 [Pleurotus eryngii]
MPDMECQKTLLMEVDELLVELVVLGSIEDDTCTKMVSMTEELIHAQVKVVEWHVEEKRWKRELWQADEDKGKQKAMEMEPKDTTQMIAGPRLQKWVAMGVTGKPMEAEETTPLMDIMVYGKYNLSDEASIDNFEMLEPAPFDDAIASLDEPSGVPAVETTG